MNREMLNEVIKPIISPILAVIFFLVILKFAGFGEEKKIILTSSEIVTTNKDIIKIRNGSNNAVGILVDGQDTSGFVNDGKFISNSSSINVGKLTHSAQSNEVIGFTKNRPPKYLNTPWTNNSDHFDLVFNSKIYIPVTVWIVKGPFAAQKNNAKKALEHASQIWQKERMGVGILFPPEIFIDATGDTDAPAHYAFPNGDLPNIEELAWKPLRNDIGFKPGQLNIYWVGIVNGTGNQGWSNADKGEKPIAGAQIVMGEQTTADLLVHEMGHALSLGHINGFIGTCGNFFNDKNIMHGYTNIRNFITEGQLFRSHLQESSIINTIYKARPGELTRICNHSTTITAECPGLQKRVWADGNDDYPCTIGNTTCSPN